MSSSKKIHFVPLTKLIEEFNLEITYAPENLGDIKIVTEDVNRPGLQLAGFFDYFDASRIQMFGKVETTYLSSQTSEQRLEVFGKLFAKHIPAVIYSRDIKPFYESVEMAKKYKIPILCASDSTASLMSAMIASLKIDLAPRIRRHGNLIEVYGEGLLIIGDSGVGKSETALELIKRGHRLVADDAVEIKKVSTKTLVGSPTEIIKHNIELRGIGVVDVRTIFGAGSVKTTERIDLVVNLVDWERWKIVSKNDFDPIGVEDKTMDILGVHVRSLDVPVKVGRNLAMIIEVAAMDNRLRKMGINSARKFLDRVDSQFDE